MCVCVCVCVCPISIIANVSRVKDEHGDLSSNPG